MSGFELDEPVEPRKPSRWRRWLLRIALGIALAIGCALVEAYWDRTRAERELREAVAEVDAKAPGWHFEDIEKQRRAITDDHNGALLVGKVQAQLPKPWPSWDDSGWSQQAQDLGEENLEALRSCITTQDPATRLDDRLLGVLRSELDRVAGARAHARKLAEYPEGRYAIDWKLDFLNTLLKDVEISRPVSRLLAYDALVRAEAGDIDGAWLSGHAGVNVGRSIGDEPVGVSQLVRTQEVGAALLGLERTLARGEPKSHDIELVQRLLEDEAAEMPALWLQALRAERAQVQRALEAYEESRLTLDELFGEPRREPSRWDALDVWRWARILRAHAAYLRDMTALIEATRLAALEQPPRIQAIVSAAQAEKKVAIFSYVFLLGTGKLPAIPVRHQARLRSAAAGLAAERYRRDRQGHWPRSVEAMVPRYMAQVPADPYDGKPLRLRLLPDGLVVYSVGPDGEDNGGKLDREKPDTPGTDIGFRLWDVAQRRQPTAPTKE
jgi:hypothetical protein